MTKPITISLIHPSTRTAAVERAHMWWLEKFFTGFPADPLVRLEIVLAYHDSQQAEFTAVLYPPVGFSYWPYPSINGNTVCNDGGNHPTLNGRSSYVDNVNLAAAAAIGDILVLATDDLEPPALWDTQIIAAIGDTSREAILRVSHGDPSDSRDAIIHPIMTRARYERQGWFVCPEYSGVFSDNDLAARGRMDDVVIEAPHLQFHHHHPLYDPSALDDDWYAAGNTAAEYERGYAIFADRYSRGFPLKGEQA